MVFGMCVWQEHGHQHTTQTYMQSLKPLDLFCQYQGPSASQARHSLVAERNQSPPRSLATENLHALLFSGSISQNLHSHLHVLIVSKLILRWCKLSCHINLAAPKLALALRICFELILSRLAPTLTLFNLCEFERNCSEGASASCLLGQSLLHKYISEWSRRSAHELKIVEVSHRNEQLCVSQSCQLTARSRTNICLD